MKKVRIKDLTAYEAPGHFGMTAMRIHGKEETGGTKFWMGLSHFLPGGGAQWAYEDNPLEKIYHVLDGEITVKSKNETYVLEKGDTLYLGPNEGREVVNDSNLPASMLVVINYPE
jgi:glyoxylate utilization-related uncharacterized protein